MEIRYVCVPRRRKHYSGAFVGVMMMMIMMLPSSSETPSDDAGEQ